MSRSEPRMWPGQRGFRALAQADAVELLRSLAPDLAPRIALIGVPLRGGDVALEPAGGDAVHSALTALLAQLPPLSDQQAGALLGEDAFATALARGCPPLAGRGAVTTFCAHPQTVGDHAVVVTLQVAADAAARYGTGPTSLVAAAIAELLAECAAALARPDRGRYGVLAHEAPDVLRRAGKRVMLAPGALMHGMRDLYDVCTVISTMRYEGADGIGGLRITAADDPKVRVALALERPIDLRDYRTVRKVLEIADAGLHLLCSDGEVRGFGDSGDDGDGDDSYLIAFAGQHHWRLLHGAQVAMEVRFGQPSLPKQRLEQGPFAARVAAVFPEMSESDRDALWALVDEATRQRHGTMVVVSAGAASEAIRLGTQAIPTTARPLTPALMRHVTAIDGAVLLDPRHHCHAIGAILDGLASSAGDPARGARYNSAIRYVASSPHPCLAIVVSEDGMIDVITRD
jgi:hypothetical protein